MIHYRFLYKPYDAKHLILIDSLSGEFRHIQLDGSARYRTIFASNDHFYVAQSLDDQSKLVIEQLTKDMECVDQFTIAIDAPVSVVQILDARQPNDAVTFLLKISQANGAVGITTFTPQGPPARLFYPSTQDAIIHALLADSPQIFSIIRGSEDAHYIETYTNDSHVERKYLNLSSFESIWNFCCFDTLRGLTLVHCWNNDLDDIETLVVDADGNRLLTVPTLKANEYFHVCSERRRVIWSSALGFASLSTSDLTLHSFPTAQIDDTTASFSRNLCSENVCAIVHEADGAWFIAIEGTNLRKIMQPLGNGLGEFCHIARGQ